MSLNCALPGRSQKGLEEILGPSLDTGYFKKTGRDLIYVLGIARLFYSHRSGIPSADHRRTERGQVLSSGPGVAS